MRRGEIWLGNLNPNRGAEIGKIRPVLIVQADFLIAQGDPTIINRHMILPATGTPHTLMNADYFASLGMTITGMPALNAMRAVVEARPGLLTSADLPLRAFAGRFHDLR